MSTARSEAREAGSPDYRDLLHAFGEFDVKYLIVGAYAVAFYTEPRFTKDLDVWVEATPENAERVWRALATFGAPVKHLSIADLCDSELVFQVGVAPNRIDVLMGIAGLDFPAAWRRKKRASYLGVPVYYIGFEDLVRAKRASGRPQDRLDVQRLIANRGGRGKRRR